MRKHFLNVMKNKEGRQLETLADEALTARPRTQIVKKLAPKQKGELLHQTTGEESVTGTPLDDQGTFALPIIGEDQEIGDDLVLVDETLIPDEYKELASLRDVPLQTISDAFDGTGWLVGSLISSLWGNKELNPEMTLSSSTRLYVNFHEPMVKVVDLSTGKERLLLLDLQLDSVLYQSLTECADKFDDSLHNAIPSDALTESGGLIMYFRNVSRPVIFVDKPTVLLRLDTLISMISTVARARHDRFLEEWRCNLATNSLNGSAENIPPDVVTDSANPINETAASGSINGDVDDTAPSPPALNEENAAMPPVGSLDTEFGMKLENAPPPAFEQEGIHSHELDVDNDMATIAQPVEGQSNPVDMPEPQFSVESKAVDEPTISKGDFIQSEIDSPPYHNSISSKQLEKSMNSLEEEKAPEPVFENVFPLCPREHRTTKLLEVARLLGTEAAVRAFMDTYVYVKIGYRESSNDPMKFQTSKMQLDKDAPEWLTAEGKRAITQMFRVDYASMSADDPEYRNVPNDERQGFRISMKNMLSRQKPKSFAIPLKVDLANRDEFLAFYFKTEEDRTRFILLGATLSYIQQVGLPT